MVKDILRQMAEAAAAAHREMLRFGGSKKSEILEAISEELQARENDILEANAKDVELAKSKGRSIGFIDKLTITPQHFSFIMRSWRAIADSKDPIGETVSRWIRPNGLEIVRTRVPLGVVGVALESRSSVTALSAAACLKVNNSLLIVGEDDVVRTNTVLIDAIKVGGMRAGMPEHAVQYLASKDSMADSRELVSLDGLVDIAILRCGCTLIKDLIAHAKIPILKHGGELCHVYIDEAADVDMAVKIVKNSRLYSPYICTTAKVILVHKNIAEQVLGKIEKAFPDKSVEFKADERAIKLMKTAVPADANDWIDEHQNTITLTILVVDTIDDAIAHINRYGSHLSDSIVTTSESARDRFLRLTDSACVYHNAATVFTDGSEFGIGQDIGLGTDKLYARGPISMYDLTSLKYMIYGKGQLRS